MFLGVLGLKNPNKKHRKQLGSRLINRCVFIQAIRCFLPSIAILEVLYGITICMNFKCLHINYQHHTFLPYAKPFFVQPRLTSHNSFSRIKTINVEWVTLQWGRWRIFYMVVFQSREKDNYMLIFPGELLLGGEKLSKTGIQKSNFHMSGENFCPFNYNSCHILIMWITV